VFTPTVLGSKEAEMRIIGCDLHARQQIRGLQRLIETKELENAVRDYIAKDPWLIHPRWETFKVEKTVGWILKQAAADVGLGTDKFRGRVDLALRSGGHLLVVEFVRPGKKIDWDHLSRCRRYVLKIRDIVAGEAQLGINQVTGLVVAEQLDSAGDVKQELVELHKSDITAYSWPSRKAALSRPTVEPHL
jgi:hypothetical protein